MIVLDASTFVSATFGRDRVPNQDVRRAFRTGVVAVSEPVLSELIGVVYRPRLQHNIDLVQRADLLQLLHTFGIMFAPSTQVLDCRDAKDNKYLELALAARAGIIVSSDEDLLTLDPWRGVRILRPADYLAQA